MFRRAARRVFDVRALLLVIAVLPLAAPARAAGDSDKGRDLARQHCVRCHVVEGSNSFAGIGSTPSFMILAKRSDWRERFETFFARPPHPVFIRLPGVEKLTDLPSAAAEIELELEDVDHLTAYAESLRPD